MAAMPEAGMPDRKAEILMARGAAVLVPVTPVIDTLASTRVVVEPALPEPVVPETFGPRSGVIALAVVVAVTSGTASTSAVMAVPALPVPVPLVRPPGILSDAADPVPLTPLIRILLLALTDCPVPLAAAPGRVVVTPSASDVVDPVATIPVMEALSSYCAANDPADPAAEPPPGAAAMISRPAGEPESAARVAAEPEVGIYDERYPGSTCHSCVYEIAPAVDVAFGRKTMFIKLSRLLVRTVR
jgi:hypothetical protein